MYVRRLELADFRSYPQVVVEFEPGPNLLVGPNGVGKTNLVEALGYVATLDSHRVATDAPLVRAGASSAIVRCAVIHDQRELLVEIAIEPGRANRARLNGAPKRRPRDVLGALRMILFAPEDLALVRGDPSERRRYLDDLLVARQPRFAAVRADYDRVVKQRNALLRTAYLARKTGAGERDLSTLEVWDTHLAAYGSELDRRPSGAVCGPCSVRHQGVRSGQCRKVGGFDRVHQCGFSPRPGSRRAARHDLGGVVARPERPRSTAA